MKKSVGVTSVLALGLLSGCSTQGIGNLAVHEALFYGGSVDRIAWVYGTLDDPSGSVGIKLGDVSAALRSQISGDPLALPGTLSVDGKAIYRGRTSATTPRINVLKVGTGYSIQALSDVSGVYLGDGGTWSKLSGPISAGQTVLAGATPTTALRGAGNLTDAEADAIAAQLRTQGALAVAVLPAGTLPDAPLKTEPALSEVNYKATGLYIQAGIGSAAVGSGSNGSTMTPITLGTGGTPAGIRQLAAGTNATTRSFQVVVARDAAGLNTLSALSYGNQTPPAALPAPSTGNSAVGVFLGGRPTGGYGLSLASAQIVGGVLTLNLNLTAPGPGSITAQVLTSPWVVIEVPGSFTSVIVKDAATGQTLK
ncbi:protease complex subunit PrcB family protein [Deinococcus sp.]|uniref:protease complex subunit PrcB family protein n=1 Tax=Deinococcus sp. TaxID=47478 RepID=UPI003CC6D4B1